VPIRKQSIVSGVNRERSKQREQTPEKGRRNGRNEEKEDGEVPPGEVEGGCDGTEGEKGPEEADQKGEKGMKKDIEMMEAYRSLAGFVHGFQIARITQDSVHNEWVLEPEDSTKPSVRANVEFVKLYRPTVGGYYVVSDATGIAFYYPGELFHRTFGKVTSNEDHSSVSMSDFRRLTDKLREMRKWISGALEAIGLDDNDFNAERLKLICRSLKDDLNKQRMTISSLESDVEAFKKQVEFLTVENQNAFSENCKLRDEISPAQKVRIVDVCTDEVAWRREVLKCLRDMAYPGTVVHMDPAPYEGGHGKK
jgi:hypothetical protein